MGVRGHNLSISLLFIQIPLPAWTMTYPSFSLAPYLILSQSPLLFKYQINSILIYWGWMILCLYFCFLFKSFNQPEQWHTNLSFERFHYSISTCVQIPFIGGTTLSQSPYFVWIPLPVWTMTYQPLFWKISLLHLHLCSNPIYRGYYSVSISIFCLNPLTSLNNDIPTSLFGTLSYSVSISTFVQIPN